MRHAEADPLEAGLAVRDADRRLTEKGLRQARRMGRLLARMEVKLDQVCASPFARAQETAEEVLDVLDSPVKIRTLDELKPVVSSDDMWEAIREAAGEKVLVVGHMPSLGNLAAALLDCHAEQPLWFHKSTIAAFHCELSEGRKPRFQLEWMAAPGMARRLIAREIPEKSAD